MIDVKCICLEPTNANTNEMDIDDKSLFCENCHELLEDLRMQIVEGPCWKCNESMKVAVVQAHDNDLVRGISNNLGPNDFTSFEIDYARSKGVLLEMHQSRTIGQTYLANTCGGCGSFAGEHFLFTQYVAPANRKELESETYDLGKHCPHCSA